MNQKDNERYNQYFEKHCRRRGGHFRIELDDLLPLKFSTPLEPENINPPHDGNLVTYKEYLWPFIKYATYTNQ